MASKLQLLVGDRFQADCKEPKLNIKENAIVLKRDAACIITKPSKEDELAEIKVKFEGWRVNESNWIIKGNMGISDNRELCCFECCCDGKDFHDMHTGSDKTQSFSIFRIEKHPAMCTRRIYGEIVPYAEFRQIISATS